MSYVSPELIEKVKKARKSMDQIGIVIGLDKETDRILGFKFIHKTNVHFDLEQIFGKDHFKGEFISDIFYVGELNNKGLI